MIEFMWEIVWPMALYEISAEICRKILAGIGELAAQTFSAVIVIVILGIIYWKNPYFVKKYRDRTCLADAALLGEAGVSGSLLFNNLITFSGLKNRFMGYRQTAEVLFAPPLWFQMVSMGIVIPMAEELIFRGFIYISLRKRYSFWAAGLLSSGIFGVYHGNLVQGLYALALGVFLAYSYEQYHSIFVPWAIHGIANLTSILAGKWIGYEENIAGVSFLFITGLSGVGLFFAIDRMRRVKQKEVSR